MPAILSGVKRDSHITAVTKVNWRRMM